MANVTAYVMTVWVNLPTKSSPIDASNLNHVEQGIKNVTDFVNTINAESGMYLSQTPFTTVLKNKLDGIEANANNYTLPTASTSTKGGVKVDGTTITIDENGVITSTVSASQLSNLTDVDLTQLADGQILKWDATNSKWVNSSEAEVRTQLSLLEDVDITDPQDGDGLFYNGTTEKWENGPVETGGDVLDYDDTMEVLGRPEPINSGSGGYTKTVVWYNNGTPAAYNTDNNFSQDISGFDQLLLIANTAGDVTNLGMYVSDHVFVDVDSVLEYGGFSYHGYFKRFFNGHVTSTKFNYTGGCEGESATYVPLIYKIYGIKY